MSHTDDEYIKFDPFSGDEAKIACRTAGIRKARKEHLCYTLTNPPHKIKPGERYRHERARIDDSFWGDYRICLRCMDELIEGST